MKKSKLFILGAVISAAISLSGCFMLEIVNENNQQEFVVDPPKIDVVTSLKINLSHSNQKTINPTLLNSSLKNPEYIYSSSNTNVATVTNDGVVTGHSVGSTTITITLKSNTSVKATVSVTVVDETKVTYDYTIMLYMCGSDLEFYSKTTPRNEQGFFTDDILEILSVKNIPDSVKIIIETGGAKGWLMDSKYLEGTTKISSTNLQRWEVNNETNKLKLIETLPTNYMAKQSSFTEFLNWGLEDYAAEQMGVVLSGHGGGIAGCAYDDNYTYIYSHDRYPYCLRTFEVASAAKSALENAGRDKFTWIGYDCCLMQCADIASINADYFEYMVASQELENAVGWNHDGYLPYIKNNTKISPTELLPKICDAFILENHSNIENGENICYQTLSVLDLSKMNNFTTAFNTLSQTLGTNKLAYNKAKTMFENASSYYSFGEKVFGLCDFSLLLKEFENEFYNITSCETALSNLVIYNTYCSKYTITPCGLNAFFPDCLDDKKILQVGKEDYSNALSTKFSYWQNMCVNYGTFGWDSI